ncbi:Imm52 family immunity protein [Metapseudomonas otitidis]|uniref:Imm52 family immunity protein n=1 Tax=Metapseudomonas otitidis TaxID=319939 RepID=UPI0013F5A803|nr:Imm52 family immunity protein [Pseudomonas otitidis]
MSDYYASEEFIRKAKTFRKFTFHMRFNKNKIESLSLDEHILRTIGFLKAIGSLSPILKNWFLCGNSPEAARHFSVMDNPESLRKEITNWADAQDSPLASATQYSVWNGEEDIFKGGLAFSYFAHAIPQMPAYMEFEEAGALVAALPDSPRVIIDILKTAAEYWPELEWGVAAPTAYYLKLRTFKDRLTAGWICYCPYLLKKDMFPEAEELILIPERGTIVVSCSGVMDEKNKAHYERVGDIDTKLVELGYLPMFNT